jgi:hypothetical protein
MGGDNQEEAALLLEKDADVNATTNVRMPGYQRPASGCNTCRFAEARML